MANSNNNEDDESWDIKFRQDEEMEFFTELALHETERWVSAVTRKKFSHPDDFRKSLDNGVLLCECLNNIKPGSVKRINKLPTPIAGLDNINVFLSACKKSFGLNENQLFDPCDLEDLSQRAIADSQYLKQEVDRRAINVAITVYWLGKSIEHTYSGPQLDQSAFAAFVRHHGKDLISDNHLRNESLESNEQSSANSSHDSYSKVSNNDCLETKNSCDSSYESYGSYTNSKESELSFNLEEDENMPASNRSNMRRYASAGSLYSTGGYQFSVPSNSSANIDSRNDSAYQSNPDLVNNHHRRGSSTDSMDSSSYYGNHSRQSSTEGNVDIPTRTLNSQRKVSTSSMDPLQFVKSKPSQKLAEEAEKQIQAAQEVKKVRTIIEKEDDDWYQNLSSWKHKRRRASAATYQRVEETDQIAQEEEEKRKTKTYSQMKEDREKRKSTGMLNFYPIDDDDDDFFSKKSQKASNRKSAPVEDTIAPARAVEIESAPSTRRRQPLSLKDRSSSLGSDSYVKYSDTDVADWAKNDEDDNSGQREGGEKGGNSVEDQQDKFSTETSYDSKRKVSDDNKVQRGKDTNNEEDSVPSWKRTSARNNEHSLNSGLRNSPEVNAPKSTSKISNLLKSFEKKDDDIGHSEKPKKSFEFSVESGRKRTMWQEREKGEVQALKPKALGKEAEKSNTKEKHNTKPKEFVEKNIKINQKPNNAKGFGFVIAGGVDKKKPVVVQKVNIGSAADVCELQMKDQILSVNKRDISHMTQPQVQRIIDDAVRVGQIEVKVKREVYEEDDDIEDDAFEMESQKAHPAVIEDTFKPVSFSPVQSQHRSFSPVQSQHRSYSPVQSKHRSYSPVQSQHRSYSPVQSQQRSVSPTQQRISPVTSQQRNSPLLRKERSSASPLTNEQQTTINSVPAKRPLPTNRIETYNSSLTNKMEDDLESEKMWILQQLGGIKTETNNNVTKTVESESEDESEDDEQQQVKDTKPEIVFSREATLQETPTNVETQVIERPTITRKQQRDPEPDRSVMETVISPVAQMSIESPPPPPKDAPPPLKPSTLDVEGFKPPDILKRWQRGSRSRSDYSSSPNSLDSDSEKRWSSSSLPWQNEKKKYSNVRSNSETFDLNIHPQVSSECGPSVGKSWLQQHGGLYGERRTQSDSALKHSNDHARSSPSVSRQEVGVNSVEKAQKSSWHGMEYLKEQNDVLSTNIESLPGLQTNNHMTNSITTKKKSLTKDFYTYTTNSRLFRSVRANSDETYERRVDGQSFQMRSKSEGFYNAHVNRYEGKRDEIYTRGQSSHRSFPWHSQFRDSASFRASNDLTCHQYERAYRDSEEDDILGFVNDTMRASEVKELTDHPEVKENSGTDPSVLTSNDHLVLDTGFQDRNSKLERFKFDLMERKVLTDYGEFDNADTSSTQRSPNYQPEKDQSDACPQQYDAKVGQPVTLQIDTSQDSQLIIDPRNQMGYMEEPTIPQYTFHVNIQKPKEVMEVTNLESRERMRDEEQVRNEEERKRIELAEKEEQLRRQEEQIRLERERLKQEQERIQRQKEEMEKRKHIEPEDKRSYNSYTNRNEVNGSDRPSENVTQFSVNINSNQAMPRKLEAVWAPSSNLYKEKERWSREDMLAMNRKPTPLQKKPENESTDDTSDSQVVRSAPTKQDLHNLNAVPKPRYRASEDWKQAQKSDEQNDVQYRRKSEHANSNSHWLVEEAERRRQQDKSKRHSVHTPFMRGPIKPVQDGPANKWLDDSSVIQRHTYTANNVTSPRSLSTRQFSAKPQSQLSQTLPANFNKIPKKEPLVPPKPARSSPNPQSPSSPPSHAEQIMAVSGKQLCSHCNNELGFGAAMVIESLGLYYHVQCFRCCVCQTCLGNGSQGADVRVRVNKLHCRNCYSNDEAGLKFSKV